MEVFIACWNQLAAVALANALAKGFDRFQDETCFIALAHSELSECLEAYRHNNPPSDHIPEFSSVEEELADVVIRVMDHSAARGYRTAEAILAKMKFNAGRPMMHGRKRY